MNTLVDLNQAIQSSYNALACNLPESIRPILLNELERLTRIAQAEQATKDHVRRIESTKYNGWTNRETWVVNLWWEGCPIEEIEADTKEEAQDALAEQLESLFDELYPTPENGLLADLMGGAVSRIDWRELAEHWIDDIQVTLTETEEEAEEETAPLATVLTQIEELKGIFGSPSEKITQEDIEILKQLSEENV